MKLLVWILAMVLGAVAGGAIAGLLILFGVEMGVVGGFLIGWNLLWGVEMTATVIMKSRAELGLPSK